MTEDSIPHIARAEMSALAAPEVAEARGDPLATDVRLQAAFAHLAKGGCDVLSVDLFDALMWRKLPEPVLHAPYLLGARLAAEGLLAHDIGAGDFAALRGRAEVLARNERRAGRGTQVTLRDICARFPAEALRGITLDGLMDREVELERTLLVPDLDVVELVRWAGEREVRVICVSDTHFSEIQLHSFLTAAPAAALQIERVFSSSTRGVGTPDGLWQIVLEEIAVRPADVVHIGAHPATAVDATDPGAVCPVYFERCHETLAPIIRAEEQESLDPLNPYHGDYGLTALRSKVLNRVECRTQPPELRPSWRFGAASLGAPLAGFAEWVVDCADEAGTSRVLCMMPAGRLMAQMVNAAASSVGSDVTAEAVGISAEGCARASVSTELGSRAVRYLEQVRLQGEDRLTFVDVGWGAGQPLLDGLLRTAGSELRTSELSLIAADPARGPMPGRRGFLSGTGATPAAVDVMARIPDVLGWISMREGGWPVGAEPALQPVSEALEDTPMQWARRESVRKGILAFQREWVRYRTGTPDALVPLHEHGQDRLRSMLVAAFSAPAADEAIVAARRTKDESVRSPRLEPLVSPSRPTRRLLGEARRAAGRILPLGSGSR